MRVRSTPARRTRVEEARELWANVILSRFRRLGGVRQRSDAHTHACDDPASPMRIARS